MLVVVLGFLFRLVDLDDPPLDFNPTRQLRSAIIARGIYYAGLKEVEPEIQALAISYRQAMEKLEPPIVETIVAFIYRLMGSEMLWVSKIISSIFWFIGAFFLFDLGRRMESPLASLFGVCYFIFLPFGIQASRSFQPDPLLTMGILLSAWALYRWNHSRSWKWVIIVGLSGGMTGLIKPVGLLFVGGMALGIYLYSIKTDIRTHSRNTQQNNKFKRTFLWNPKIWVMVVLMVSPFLIYYLLGIRDETSGYFKNWTIVSHWRDVLSPSFFIRWMIQVDNNLNLVVVLAGLLGTLVASGENRALLFGFWAGYILLGFLFPHHILTHNYYHLPLVGLVALSLVPLFGTINKRIIEQGLFIQVAYVALFLFFSFYNGWIGRSILLGNDYHDHPQFWREIGNAIPSDAKTIGITQDYGFRLMYYGWRKVGLWPQGAEVGEFNNIAKDVEYFVITAKNQASDDLTIFLDTHYPVFAEGVGYVIYNISQEE